MADLMHQKAALRKQLSFGPETEVVACSSESGLGIDELKKAIERHLAEA